MPEPFAGFDLADFWDNSAYSRKTYVDEPLTDELLADIEAELGVRLPASYVYLMRTTQNGGTPRNTCMPTKERTSWAEDHVAITGIGGIGRGRSYSVCGDLGSQFMKDEWGYPEIGVVICDCPSAGHDVIMLDYRECGPTGEPSVVHVDQECDYAITPLAKTFEDFVLGLVNESEYDDSAEQLAQALEAIDSGRFSSALRKLMKGFKPKGIEAALRSLLRELTTEKGYFALHADSRSMLVYDTLFLLATERGDIDADAWLESDYQKLIAFGDGNITTRGYAPGFLQDWLKKRRKKDQIVRDGSRSAFSDDFREKVLKSLNKHGLG